jgi:hypothetical protein
MEFTFEQVKTQAKVYRFCGIILGIVAFILLGDIVIMTNDFETKKKEINAQWEKREHDKTEHNLILIKNLMVEKEMLETAILNMESKSMNTYSIPMQKMIIAAKQGHKIDFDFYIRMMQEENKKH